MKTLVLSNIIQGVRRLGAVKATFEHLQEAILESTSDILYGILAQVSGVTALFGCVNSGSGSNYIISAGSVYYNGEIYKVDAFSGTAGGGQVPVLTLATTYRAGDPVKYSDNNNYNTHAIRKLAWGFAASGSGLSDYSALSRLNTRINSNLLDVPGQIASGITGKADIASPTFTGNPKAPTPSAGDNDTSIATTAFVSTAIANLINSAPGLLDTLGEISDALNDDPNFYTTMVNLINGKVAKSGDSMTGPLAMGSNKITGLANGTANGDAVNFLQHGNKLNQNQDSATSDVNNFSTGIQSVAGDITNAPAGTTNADGFIIITLGDKTNPANGHLVQVAIQTKGASGGGAGTIYERHTTALLPQTWTAWTQINN
jgi:hypothetical protein